MIQDSNFDAQDAAPYEPSDDEIARMRAATPVEASAIDALILRECTDRWKKVAKIVGDLIPELDRSYPHLPYAYIQARMDELEDMGKLDIVGYVWSMRYSEVRLLQSESVKA